MAIVNFDGLTSNPSTPATNRVKLFARNDLMFFMDDTGAVFSMGGGVGRVSVADINDPSPELNTREGVAAGDLIIAFEDNVGADDIFTIYAWDTSPPGAEDVPFTVDGLSGGRWIAIAGRFQNQSIESVKDQNFIRFFFDTFAQLPSPTTFHGAPAHLHAAGDPVNHGTWNFAHADSWRMTKDFNDDDEVTLTPAATVNIDFGRTSATSFTYQNLTLDQDTTLTESNPIAGVVRVLRVSSGSAGQSLTFPGSWEVFGSYDKSGAANLIEVTCVSPSVEELRSGSPPPAGAYVANITTLVRGRGNSQTGLGDSATGLLTINGPDPAHLDIKDSEGQIENRTDLTNIFPDGITWSGLTDIALPNIATTPFTNIYIVETAPGSGIGVELLENTPSTPASLRTRIFLGTAIHQAGTVIEQLLTIPILSYDSASSLVDLFGQIGDKNNSGNVYEAAGTNRLLTKLPGSVFGRQINILVDPLNPHNAAKGALTSITPYTFSRRNGVGGLFTFSQETDVDTDFFDDNGTLSAIPVGRFVHYPIHFDPRSDVTILEYSQRTYATKNEAIDGINQNNFAFNGLISNIEITTWLIVQGGNANFSNSTLTEFRLPLEHAVSPSGTLSHDVLTNVTSDQHHAQVHTIVSHDTTATGANLTELTNSSTTALHTHAGIGGALIFVWDFSTNTSESDPGTGNFRFDSATPASVTRIYIDSVTGNGLNVDNFFSQLNVGEEIAVQQSDDPSKVILFEITAITDNTGWWRIDVTVESSAGTLFQNNRQCVFVFHTGNSPVSHDDLIDVTPNQHHPQLHTIVSHSDTTATGSELDTLTGAGNADALHTHAHSAITGVSIDQHHARDHASAHSQGGADQVTIENLRTASTDANQFIRPDGSNGVEFVDTPTKEIFLAATNYGAIQGDFRVRNVTSTGDFEFTFSVPLDFAALVSLELIGISVVTNAAADIDLFSDYGALGQAPTNHSEANTTITFNITTNTIEALDISSVFSSLAAGDFCGLFIDHNAIGGTIGYIGILMKYTI